MKVLLLLIKIIFIYCLTLVEELGFSKTDKVLIINADDFG
jgi:hypothetical protein